LSGQPVFLEQLLIQLPLALAALAAPKAPLEGLALKEVTAPDLVKPQLAAGLETEAQTVLLPELAAPAVAALIHQIRALQALPGKVIPVETAPLAVVLGEAVEAAKAALEQPEQLRVAAAGRVLAVSVGLDMNGPHLLELFMRAAVQAVEVLRVLLGERVV
jgi:hypothetical protein